MFSLKRKTTGAPGDGPAEVPPPARDPAAPDADDPSPYVRRGDQFNRDRRWIEAGEAYAEALRRGPSLAHIWVQYGHALKEQGALHGAIAAYGKAVALRPQDSDAHLQLGHALKLRGRLGDALAAYEAAAVCAEPHPEAERERADLATRLAWNDAPPPPPAYGPAALATRPGPAPGRPIPGPAPVAIRVASPLVDLETAPCRRTWLAENAVAAADAVLSAAEGREVLSLDVFDTLLLRGREAEAARYVALSERIAARADFAAAGLGADDALLARVAGLRDSYRARPKRDGCGEGCLDEALDWAARSLGGGEALRSLMEEQEIAFEADALTVNPALRLAVERWRAGGGRVILISDMYLRATHIEAILRRLDPALADMVDATHSSADWLFSKRSGRLYGAVAGAMGLPATAFLHVGDSLEGDVRMARRAGWAALHHPVSEAELAARRLSLQETIARFAARDLDISDWAQL